MEKTLSWEEIKRQYSQEWILLEDYDWPDEEIDPRAGRVILHASTRAEFDRLLSKNDESVGKEVAILYTGQPLISQAFRGGFAQMKIG